MNKVENNNDRPVVTESREFKLFKKITALPYLLVLLALLMPLANVSCSFNDSDTKPVLEANIYSFAVGLDLDKSLSPKASEMLHNMVDKNQATKNKLLAVMPDFPKMQSMPYLWGIVLAVILAALFAFVTPLGSLTMGMLGMFSLWAFLLQVDKISAAFGIPMLKVGPGVGIYAASTLIIIGTAMNLASIIRPIVVEIKRRKAASKK